jgi:predicted phosphoribosyltransferase
MPPEKPARLNFLQKAGCLSMGPIVFRDRRDAGRRLAAALAKESFALPVLVLGIPRGGVVVAHEAAEALSAPLDVIVARKIRAPRRPELGIGSVVDGEHITLLNGELVRAVGAGPEYLKKEIAYQEGEIDRRLKFYRGDRPAPRIEGRAVIVIDDGIATGYTFRAALEGVRRKQPGALVGAAPVAARDGFEMLKSFADEMICLSVPVSFAAVGKWYADFEQVSDEEVAAILRGNWGRYGPRQEAGA